MQEVAVTPSGVHKQTPRPWRQGNVPYTRAMRHIRIWAYDGILASGVMGPIDVFTTVNVLWARKHGREGKAARLFEWRIESPDGKPVRTASGHLLQVDGPLNARSAADAVMVPAPFFLARFLEKPETFQPLFAALRRQHERGAVLASYCTGSFILAEAGLLDGRLATTHWAMAKAFEQRYPQVELRAAEIMTEQNRIVCSGAVTTHLNLALRLVEKFAGTDLAAMAGRLLLIDANRVSQAPYAIPLEGADERHGDPVVARAQRWMERHLQRAFSLAELAAHLALSERTVNRRFTSALGEPPLRYLQRLRIEVAKRLLETGTVRLEAVSERVGYADLSTFRRLFKRRTGLAPRDYQRRFAQQRVKAAPSVLPPIEAIRPLP